ncbi:MAG: hypothetical protein KKG33_09555 [candidate division Zixibacteria bacterium]|nr:hypothetical protein [candidate division Zixibacteria bacterium]MBU1471279.1 hypothetical protein [candidate division Zixibacteria bacterium]MBU2625792.1 hypothetical protein [candidate division Zixibacteria bacterium]
MEYFENIVKRLLEQEGYWVRQSVKVSVTKLEKRAIGKHSIPRPEIDLVGYSARENELLIVEVKSFLDSPGVRFNELTGEYKTPEGSYKLFTCENYRKIVFSRLKKDLFQASLILKNPSIRFGLAAGKIYSKDEPLIVAHFKKRNWILYTPSDIAKAIEELEKIPYENDPYVIASKILIRNDRLRNRD